MAENKKTNLEAQGVSKSQDKSIFTMASCIPNFATLQAWI